jgi:hypothetical protein
MTTQNAPETGPAEPENGSPCDCGCCAADQSRDADDATADRVLVGCGPECTCAA